MKYKIPYQGIELSLPDPNQLFRVKGSNTLGYVKDGQIYTTSPSDFSVLQKYTRQPGTGIGAGLGAADLGDWTPTQQHEQSGIEQLKTKYGIDVNSLPEFSTGEAENMYKYVGGGLDWGSVLKNGNLGGTPGPDITATINPANPNSKIDVPTSSNPAPPPADYLKNLLGSGQGIGGLYTYGGSGYVAPQSGMQKRTLVSIYDSRPDVQKAAAEAFPGQDPLQSGTAANKWLNDWWNTNGPKEFPNVTLVQPEKSNVIPADSIAPQTKLNLGTVKGSGTDDAGALVAGSKAYQKTLQDYITALSTPETETDKKYQAILDKVAELTGQEANKGVDQLAAENAQNLPALKKSLADINAEILTRSAEYDALVKNEEGKPVTMDTIIGNSRQIINAKASEIAMLTARAQALTGQVSVAQDTANRAVDLKYSTIEAQIAVYQAQLNAITPTLNREQQVRQTAQQQMIDDGKAKLAEAKQAEKDQYSTLLNLMQTYPDAQITLQDTLESANQKITKNSKIYADKIRGPVGTQPSASEKRDTAVSTFLQSKKGKDGFVSSADYQEGLRKFIAGGGTQTNFFAAFPQQTYLGSWEIEKLPAAMKPQSVTTKSDLTAEQMSIVNDAKATIDQAKQRYQDWGSIRQKIIDVSKQQYGFDISPYI